VVIADQLSKQYRVKVREPGIRGALASLVAPRYRSVSAVDRVSFRIERGEVVGFLGPNGAGKTTTLKMLTGLLYPSGGRAEVAGFNPWTGGAAFKSRMALVLGNKQQLLWDLPPEEAFRLNKSIYGVPSRVYREQRDELVELLRLEEIIDKPARQLSLGERMRCELAIALLHRPEVLLLDEPTLGLDLTAQDAIRRFLLDYNAKHGATILLTSHYMADITALSTRVLMIDHGHLLYDGSLRELVMRATHVKRLELVLADGATVEQIARFGEVRSFRFPNAVVEVPRDEATQASGRILLSGFVVDVCIQDPPVEDVIRRVFDEVSRGRASEAVA
jgi:ABC-2 type transport system ATP-binding protein